MTIDGVYCNLLWQLLTYGSDVETRNSKVKRLVAIQMRATSTPLVSVRKTAWKNALREWQWFMSGSNNINDLHSAVHGWWKPWVDENGNVWGNYSEQFRCWFTGDDDFDQIQYLLDGIKNHPFSRRNVITTWNAADMANSRCPITNCHNTVTQAFVEPDNKLHLVTYQRSVDVICGLPHNLVQMWAFLLWLASKTGRGVGNLTWMGGDVHLYADHFELARTITATYCANAGKAERVPELVYKPTSEDFLADDFSLDGEYKPLLEASVKMVV